MMIISSLMIIFVNSFFDIIVQGLTVFANFRPLRYYLRGLFLKYRKQYLLIFEFFQL